MEIRNHKLENPFVVGRYAGAYYFCDRKAETDYLYRSIENGRDVAIISPRRMGKTGLIEHLFADEMVKEKYVTLFIDIYATSSLADFASQLGQELFNVLWKRKSGWRKLLEIVSSLRPAVTVDAVSGEPTMTLTGAKISRPDFTLSEIFGYLNGSEEKYVIAIDEFQQIAKYRDENVEALLRGYIQKSPNCRFIYSGSEQSMMNAMFRSSTKPFYQSCITMSLSAIDEDEYVKFAMQRFEDYGRSGDSDVIRAVYREMNGVTWFIQMMMNELFALTERGGELEASKIDEAEKNVIGVQEYSYRELMARLSSRQRDLVIFVAKEHGVDNILSGESQRRSGFPSVASIQSALRGLDNLGIVNTTISEEMDVRRTSIYDVFFAKWVRDNY